MARGRRIEYEVRENRKDARRLQAATVEVDSRPSRDFTFDGSVIEVLVDGEVYTRPLNNTMVFGHPDAQQGFGRGTFGDGRGPWASASTDDDAQFTSIGRGVVADALEGQESGVGAAVIGSGSGPASSNDSSMGTEEASTIAHAYKQAANETVAFGTFRFHEDGGSVTEFGIEGQTNNLMASLVVSGVSPTLSEEVRVDATMTFVGDGVTGAAVTDEGEAAVADSIVEASTIVGLDELAIGTGTTSATEADTALQTEVGRKNAAVERLSERVRPFIKWYSHEPTGQPYDITEMGIFDNNGRLVLRVTFDPFRIDSNVEPTTGASIRII